LEEGVNFQEVDFQAVHFQNLSSLVEEAQKMQEVVPVS
jgi:hypothetical protein